MIVPYYTQLPPISSTPPPVPAAPHNLYFHVTCGRLKSFCLALFMVPLVGVWH